MSDNASETSPKPNATPKATILEMHGYLVGKSIGSGSYATVKEAHSKRHNCQVAIKIISKRKAPEDYLLKFLPREIDVIKHLRHPCLVTFYQCIETTNRMYLIMELAKGDLLEEIKDKKYIEEKQAAIWFSHLIEGVHYIHERGVVHRDLKCENLILDSQNNLKIADFGFARGGMQPADGRYPLSETYCGSYAYAAPEILTGTPYPPQMADVWSSGVILYVMVFGKLPFDDSNHKVLIHQVTKRGPVFDSNQQNVSKECQDIIVRMLVKFANRISTSHIKIHPWYYKVTLPLPAKLPHKSGSGVKPPVRIERVDSGAFKQTGSAPKLKRSNDRTSEKGRKMSSSSWSYTRNLNAGPSRKKLRKKMETQVKVQPTDQGSLDEYSSAVSLTSAKNA